MTDTTSSEGEDQPEQVAQKKETQPLPEADLSVKHPLQVSCLIHTPREETPAVYFPPTPCRKRGRARMFHAHSCGLSEGDEAGLFAVDLLPQRICMIAAVRGVERANECEIRCCNKQHLLRRLQMRSLLAILPPLAIEGASLAFLAVHWGHPSALARVDTHF